jgi:hypothetical protein
MNPLNLIRKTRPPVGNVHQSRKAPRPTARDIWAEAMEDEVDEPEEEGSDCICEDAFTTCEKCKRDTSNDPVFSGIS